MMLDLGGGAASPQLYAEPALATAGGNQTITVHHDLKPAGIDSTTQMPKSP